jgi:hypothetical protein
LWGDLCCRKLVGSIDWEDLSGTFILEIIELKHKIRSWFVFTFF